MTDSRGHGIIGRTYEDELPVICRLVDEIPEESTRAALPWLTVISWKYDGGDNNGMPRESVNERMVQLEQALEEELLKPEFCRHAYSRTGNSLKELVYYISDRESFLLKLNDAVSSRPPYPIEIRFYDDPQWKDFIELLGRFGQGAETIRPAILREPPSRCR